MTALARDPHRFGDVGDGLALNHDSLNEQSPSMERKTGVTVSHEDLRFVKTAISTMPGGLLASPNRHQRHGRVQLVARGDDVPGTDRLADGSMGRRQSAWLARIVT